MRKLRAIAGFCLVLGFFGALGILAWATRHPDDPRLTAARDWPVVGSTAAWLQETYLPPPATSDAAEIEEAISYRPEDRRQLDAKPNVWVAPGMFLRRTPAEDAEIVATFDLYANLPLLEERDGWRLVRFEEHRGWVAPPPDDGPLVARPPDQERLSAARALLGIDLTVRRLGAYTLYTDSKNAVLLKRLARLAVQLDDVYARRFGRRPLGDPAEAVVLFERQADYRTLQNQSSSLVGLNAAGHAGWGMAAFYRGEQDMDDVAAVFVHELTHLINRRALNPALPLWLNEGLAESLSGSRLLPWGGIEPEAWGGNRRQIGLRTTFSGEWAARLSLQNAIHDGWLPRLENVVGLDDETFLHGSPRPGLHYGIAGSFIRYLLDGEDRRYRAAFHAFLADVAGGGEPNGEALRQRLGVSWDALNDAYRSWMLAADA